MAEHYEIDLQIQGGEQPDIGFVVRDGATDGASERNAEAWAVGQRRGVDVPATDPTYHNNSKYYAEQAAHAEDDALASEGWAVGKQDGQDVPSTSPYYENNAKYYAAQAGAGKANMVSGATAGNFASLKADGDLDDSGYKPSDFITSHQDISGKADKVTGATSGNFAGLDSNGNLTDSGSKASDFLTSHQDISGKADKVTGATSGNFAGLDSNGNLTDSGSKASDFLTSHQDISGKADKVSGATNGNLAGLDSNGNLTDSGSAAGDFAPAATATLLASLQDAVAIVVDGDTSTVGAAAGQYVLVKNSTITGITDGAYTAAQAIPANTAIDSTYLTAVSGGFSNALNANMPQSFDVTANTSYFTLNFQSNCVMNGYKIINARFRVDSLPSASDIGMLELPSGMSFANYGGVIPIFKGSEWGTPSTICYGYVHQTGILVHKSDMEAGKYMYVNYCGR